MTLSDDETLAIAVLVAAIVLYAVHVSFDLHHRKRGGSRGGSRGAGRDRFLGEFCYQPACNRGGDWPAGCGAGGCLCGPRDHGWCHGLTGGVMPAIETESGFGCGANNACGLIGVPP